MRANPWILALTIATVAVGTASAKGTRKSFRHKRHPPVKLQPLPQRASEAGKSEDASAAPMHKGPTRIDFDDRLIQGQTNKAGAVYLYERKELQVRSMVKMRESFRDEIYQDAYGAH